MIKTIYTSNAFFRYMALLPMLLFLTLYRDYFLTIEIAAIHQVLMMGALYAIYYVFYKNSKWLKRVFFGLMALFTVWFVAGIIQLTFIDGGSGTWIVNGSTNEMIKPTTSVLQIQFEPITRFVTWVFNDKIKGSMDAEIPNTAYELIFFICLSILTILAMRLIIGFKYLRILFALPLIHFLWLWYSYIDLPIYLFQMYMIGLLSYFASEQMTILASRSPEYEIDHYPYAQMLKWTLAFSILILLSVNIIMIFLPIREINKVIDPLIPNLWGARSAFEEGQFKMFTLNDTAFQSNEKQLGGPILSIDRDTILFKIDFENIPLSPVYLRANVKDYYSGAKWESRANTFEANYENYLSNIDNRTAIKAIDPKATSGLVTFMGMDSLTIFAPMGLYGTDIDPNKIYTSQDNESFYKAGAFIKTLKSYRFFSTGKDFTYFSQINYLQLPKTIEPEIYDLSKSLVEGIESDRDKMTSLTRYLVTSYPYTLTPPSFNGKRDFVSEFLLDTKEGYCTYFASALTVMARINGIPARYVEGFRVDPEKDMKSYLINEGQAHAWAEVYIKGEGWTIWESTPPYSLLPDPEKIKGEQMDSDLESNVVTQTVERDNANNLALKEAMLEAEMLIGDDGEISNLPDYQRPEDSGVSVMMFIYPILMAFGLLLLGYMLLNIFTGIRRKTHKGLIQNIYFLEQLEKVLNMDTPYVFRDEKKSKNVDKAIFDKIKYDRPRNITTEICIEGDRVYEILRRQCYQNYKSKYGLIKYWFFRGFKARRYYKELTNPSDIR